MGMKQVVVAKLSDPDSTRRAVNFLSYFKIRDLEVVEAYDQIKYEVGKIPETDGRREFVILCSESQHIFARALFEYNEEHRDFATGEVTRPALWDYMEGYFDA